MSTRGFICALISAAANGSFIIPYKHPQMREVRPLVFQFYCACGVMLSSFLLVPFFPYNDRIEDDDEAGTSFRFSGLGFVAGMIFVISMVLSFSAVELIGVALAQAIWSGGAIIVSYLWGVLIFGDTPSNVGLSVTGIVVLVLGVLLIAYSETISKYFLGAIGDDSPLLEKIKGREESEKEKQNPANYRKGVMFALLVGLFGGSILAPLNYVPPEQSGLVFVPSFGIGAFVSALVIFCAILGLSNQDHSLILNQKWGLPLGILSGSIFQLSNVMSIIAIPSLGYGIAYPLLQCAILFSGIWGVFAFKEIVGKARIATFFCGGAILLSGAIMLAVAQ